MMYAIHFRNMPFPMPYSFSTAHAEFDNITHAVACAKRMSETEMVGVKSFLVEDDQGKTRAEWTRVDGEWKAYA